MRRVVIAGVALVCALTVVPVGAKTVTVVRTRDLTVPMSTGGYLKADLYQPAVDGAASDSLPTIVIYFPYSKDDATRFERHAIDRFVRAGFAALLVDIRGTGNSPGEFGLLSRREIRDGYDVVEWAATQSWSNGVIGMWGYSYPGNTAAMVAALRPPHLRAIAPGSAANDPYRDITYPGGILASQDSGLAAWLAFHAMGRARPETPPDQAVRNLINAATHPGGLRPMIDAGLHPLYDEWWRDRSLAEHARDITVPALFWSGWDDVYPRGTPLNFAFARSRHKALVMGPWGHVGGASDAPLDFFIDESIRWFDIFLRTRDAAERERKLDSFPQVRVFDVDWTASTTYENTWRGVWRSFDSWPPPHRDVPLELCASGGRAQSPPPWLVNGALTDLCEKDGTVPVAGVPIDTLGGTSATHDTIRGARANAFNDPKDPRLNPTATAFLSPPMTRATTVTGPSRAELWATTFGVDADWVVRVVDVGPQTTRVISQGWLRASHRREDPSYGVLWHTHDRQETLRPGEPYPLTIEIWPTSYRLPAGHRLGVIVQTADTLKVVSDRGTSSSLLLVGPTYRSRLVFSMRLGA